MLKRILSPLVLLAVILAVCGCGDSPPPFQQEEVENVLALVVDLSGSYQEKMATNGIAYRLLIAVSDRFFMELAGEKNRVIVSQISARRDAVLWEGTPEQLRQQFPSAEAFRAYLLSHSDPNGSPVHDAMSQTIETVLAQPGIAEGKARSVLVVLSDMEDTDAPAARQRLQHCLRRYAKTRSSLGLFFVTESLVPGWQNELRACGFRKDYFVVERSKNQSPTFPRFD